MIPKEEFSEKVGRVRNNVRELKEITRRLSEDLRGVSAPEGCGGEILDFLRIVFDELPETFIEIIGKDFQLLYTNRALRDFLEKFRGASLAIPLDDSSRKCFEAILGREAPCEGCPIVGAFESRDVLRVRHKYESFGETFDIALIPLFENGASAVLVIAHKTLEEAR
jgi:hypothetical protein